LIAAGQRKAGQSFRQTYGVNLTFYTASRAMENANNRSRQTAKMVEDESKFRIHDF
jgi:hypothetical protein